MQSQQQRNNLFRQKLNSSSYSNSYYFYIIPNEEKNNILKVIKEKVAEQFVSAAKDNDIADSDTYFKEQVKKPGLFFCIDNPEEWGNVEAFVRDVLHEYPGLKVLVHYTGRKMESKPVAEHLLVTDKRDFDLFGRQKPALKSWLADHHFDLLLVFAGKENKQCGKIMMGIDAHLKAGWAQESEELLMDISLGKAGERMAYGIFYKQLKSYFKILNIKLLP